MLGDTPDALTPVAVRRERPLPLIAVVVVVLLILAANLVVGPNGGAALILVSAGALLMTFWPEIGVYLLLGSFLVTYPSWMAGRGSLTLNNVLGAWLGMLLVYRLYREGDWEFLRRPELLLLLAIGAVFFIAGFAHGPDRFMVSLIGPFMNREQDPGRVFIGRLSFLIFFLYFIRSPRQIYVVFLLAVGLMIVSGLAGVQRVLGGGGFAGYRANFGLLIAAAGNPNRLALFSVISIVSLWFFIQEHRTRAVQLALAPLIPGLVLAVFMTGSRSGVAALLIALLLLFIQGGVSIGKILVGMFGGVAAALLIFQAAPEKSLERLGNLPGTQGAQSTLGGQSLERRGYGFEVALEIFQQNPLIGVGIGNWEVNRYLEDPTRATAPPHSSYLLALVEGGATTLGLYLLLCGRTLQSFFDVESRLGRASPPARNMLWVARSLRTAFLVFLVLSFVADLWLHVTFYWFVGLAVALRRLVVEHAEPGLAGVPA